MMAFLYSTFICDEVLSRYIHYYVLTVHNINSSRLISLNIY